MQISVIIEVDEGDPSADPDHETGITNEAYERLTGGTNGVPPLGWLGEIQDVMKVDG